MDDKVEILLKEYDVMRNEIRLYINKYYLALTAILGIFTAGIFQTTPDKSGFIFIWVPYIVAGIIGFMSIVTFFINKTAGYVRYLEWRINSIIEKDMKTQDVRSGLMLWESYYADYGMDRDSGGQFNSLFKWALVAFVFASIALMSMVLAFGYKEAERWNFDGYLKFLKCLNVSPEILFLLTATLILAVSIYSYLHVITKVRAEVRKLNETLAAFQNNA